MDVETSEAVTLSMQLEEAEARARAAGFATERIPEPLVGGWLKVTGAGWHVSLFNGSHFVMPEWQSGMEPVEVLVERTAAAVAAYRMLTTMVSPQ